MTVSPEFKAAAFAQSTGDGLLWLLTLDHASIDPPIRVVANTKDVTSNGDLYTAYPFELTFPGMDESGPSAGKLAIDNVTREIGQAIRTITGALDVTLQAVRLEDPDSVEQILSGLKLRGVKAPDIRKIEGDLVFEDIASEPHPAPIYSPAYFPGLIP